MTETNKTTKTNRANLGDIIRADEFAYGHYERNFNDEHYLVADKKLIHVDGKTKNYQVGFLDPKTRHLRESETLTIELGAYDSSRADAYFVVERAVLEGGGTGHGPHDIFPDGWHVSARRLDESGTYDHNGEVVDFYQIGCFIYMVNEVEVMGKIKMKFVREDE